MNKIFALMVVGSVAALGSAAAQEAPQGVEVGPVEYFTMTASPYSGPVETIVASDHPTAAQGTFTDVFLVVQNHSNVDTVSVNIELELVWADGTAVHPLHLGRDRVHTLGPDEGVGFLVFFVVPEDAPLGTASFRARARIGRTGADDGHRQNTNPMVAEDGTQFEVVPR